jgi:hypothetical protein
MAHLITMLFLLLHFLPFVGSTYEHHVNASASGCSAFNDTTAICWTVDTSVTTYFTGTRHDGLTAVTTSPTSCPTTDDAKVGYHPQIPATPLKSTETIDDLVKVWLKLRQIKKKLEDIVSELHIIRQELDKIEQKLSEVRRGLNKLPKPATKLGYNL